MRALLLGILLAALAPLTAHAGLAPATGQQSGNFSFILESGSANASKSAGCVHLTYAGVTDTFPKLASGTVAAIRFYYGEGDASTVTAASPFFTSSLQDDGKGNLSITPIEFCGIHAGHYNFKYGLADAAGTVLEFMAEGDFNPATNSVDVR